MPRIRTLKPEHKLHRKVGGLSHVAYRLWVGLVTEADDEGRLVCDVPQLRAVVFGLREDTPVQAVHDALDEILAVRLAVRYAVNGTRYLFFPSWREHQRIDRPKPSLHPPPPGNRKTSAQKRSTTRRRTIVEPSSNDRRTIDEPSTMHRRGSDLRKKERTGPSINPRGRVHRAVTMPVRPDDLSITRPDGPEPVAAVLTRIGFFPTGPAG